MSAGSRHARVFDVNMQRPLMEAKMYVLFPDEKEWRVCTCTLTERVLVYVDMYTPFTLQLSQVKRLEKCGPRKYGEPFAFSVIMKDGRCSTFNAGSYSALIEWYDTIDDVVEGWYVTDWMPPLQQTTEDCTLRPRRPAIGC